MQHQQLLMRKQEKELQKKQVMLNMLVNRECKAVLALSKTKLFKKCPGSIDKRLKEQLINGTIIS